jgi:hypothetical protein
MNRELSPVSPRRPKRDHSGDPSWFSSNKGLHLCDTTIDKQFRSGNVATVVSREKYRDLSDLIGCYECQTEAQLIESELRTRPRVLSHPAFLELQSRRSNTDHTRRPMNRKGTVSSRKEQGVTSRKAPPEDSRFSYYCQPPPSALYSCTIERPSFSWATAKFSWAV